MSDVVLIKNKNDTSEAKRKELAEHIHSLAERVEKGETLAVAWVELLRDDKYLQDYVKLAGPSLLGILGALECLKAEIADHLNSEE